MGNNSEISRDDQAIIDAGYKPQLKRSLGFFSSFAVTFSIMSILMGIFSNAAFVLGNAGPFGFWSWPLVGCGQLLVALVLAEMAGRIPLTGAIYNWNLRLAAPVVGWLSAWTMFFAYSIGGVAIIAAMLTPLQTFAGHNFSPALVRCIGISIILIHALINIYGVQLASTINKTAVIAEIIALIVFGSILLTVVLVHNEAHTALLATIPAKPVPYWPAFLLASLMAAWTLIGFELPSDLSEETVNVQHVAPKGIIRGLLTSVILGFLFLVVMALAIPDLTAVSAASDPISTIIAAHLGETATKLFLIFVLIAMFANGLLAMAAASRILFAVARDKRVTGAARLATVSSRKVPLMTTLLVTALEIIIFVCARDAVDLFGATTILMFLVYLITVISFAFGLKRLPPAQSFSLGRWRWPVVILAAIWLIAEIGVLTIPDDFHNAAYIAGGALVAGFLLYMAMGRRTQSQADKGVS